MAFLEAARNRTTFAALRHSSLGSDTALIPAVTIGIGTLLFVGYAENSLLATLVIGALWGAVGTFILAVESIANPFRAPLVRMFWVTFSMRIFVMAVLHGALSATEFGPWWNFGAQGGDEIGFWHNSDRLVEAWQNGTVLQVPVLGFENYFAWLHVLGFTRFLGDMLGNDTVFNARLVLSMAGALVVPYVYMMALRLFDVRVARIAAALAFWLPDYWFFSSTLLRDVLVSSLMIILFYQVVAMVHGRFSWWRLIFAVALNFGMIRFLRTDIAFINVGLVTLFFLWGYRDRMTSLFSRALRMVVLALVVVTVLSVTAPGTFSASAPTTQRVLSLDYIEDRANRSVSAGLEESGPASFGRRVLELPNYARWPVETAIVLLEPFPPWAALQGTISEPFPLKSWINAVSAMVWLGMVAFLAPGLVGLFRGQPRKTVWVWGTAFMLLLGLGFATGTHARWRLMLMPFLLIVIGQGIAIWRQHVPLLLLAAGTLVGMLALYSGLKYL